MAADPATVGRLVEVFGGRAWDRDEIRSQVANRSRRYRDAGLGPGHRALLLFGNRIDFFADLLAIWRLGGSAVPLDPRITVWELEHLAEAAAPRLALVDESTSDDVRHHLKLRGIATVDTRDTAAAGGTLPARAGGLDDDALILFTSGSTGRPKGVVHTHGSLAARWAALARSLGFVAHRRTLCVLPTHFGHGLICNALFPWLAGQDLHVAPSFRPDVIAKLGALIDEHEITFLSSVPAMWRLALKLGRPPVRGTLERVLCGSAPLGRHLWQDVQRWAGTSNVWSAYGITETGSWIAGTSGGSFVPEDGLIGPAWGTEIRIGDGAVAGPPDECRPAGDLGPVWVRTDGLMRGYLDRPDLTGQVVHDGWFATGDLGCLDERGWLWLRGREREEINKSGLKVYPADVDALVESFDGVADVCTFAVDDPLHGQEVAIAVVLEPGRDDVTADLYRWLKRRLTDYKMPARWYRLDALPRTARGKLHRDTVRDLCRTQAPLDMRRILAGARPTPS